MIKKSYTSQGIVLSSTEYKEADRLIYLFSKDYGRITLIAKGVRKLTSRKRGSLEPFSIVKFSAVKGRGIDIITESEILDSFNKIREDLKKASVAYFFSEAISKTTQEYEKHDNVYTMLCSYIQMLEESEKLKTLRKKFVQDLLTMLGFWPEGKQMPDPDGILEEVSERKLSTIRVGRKMM